MLTAVSLNHSARLIDVSPDEVGPLLRDTRTVTWLDFERPTAEEFALIERELDLHPLALEDIQKQNQRPKLDRYEDHTYLVLYHLELDADNEVHRVELDAVLGQNYLVTVHGEPIRSISALLDHCRTRPLDFGHNPLAFLVYRLADGMVDDYFPLVEHFEESLDVAEEAALDAGRESVLADIFALRKNLLLVRNTVEPMRDVFNLLARRDESFLDPSTTLYFNDVYDHLLRISTRIDGLRDLAAAALETHLSVQSNELNRTVERLTAFTLILMVVTLVTGFCGMNVNFPGRDDPLGLGLALASMLAIGASAFVLARKKRWL